MITINNIPKYLTLLNNILKYMIINNISNYRQMINNKKIQQPNKYNRIQYKHIDSSTTHLMIGNRRDRSQPIYNYNKIINIIINRIISIISNIISF